MKVAVIGAGVVGVATAHALARDGHEVVVVERRERPAMESSYGNAGLYSPSDSYAWASPDALKMAVRSLFNRDLGIQYKLRLDPALWLWSLKFLGQCTDAAARRNSLLKLRLTSYSLRQLEAVVQETGIAFGNRREGLLYYFGSKDAVAAADHHMGLLRDQGLDLRTLDREAVLATEPGLAPIAGEIAGGIYSPDCQTGSSNLFAAALVAWCAEHRGTLFRFGETVTRLRRDGDRIAGLETDRGELVADAYVLASGAECVFLARDVGLALPIYPVKGFSITAEVKDPAAGPKMGVVDEDRLVAMSRPGDRLRAASSAVFTGYDRSQRPDDFRAIRAVVSRLYGDAVNLDRAEHWCGFRPMTPSSVPILGRTPLASLYLNVGHGHVGWTMSCGSARFVADIVAGHAPEIDPVGLILPQ